MHNYLMICNAYPTMGNLYANSFLHRRVKAYQQKGLFVDVVVITTKVKKDEFYDGVHIKYMDEYQIASYLQEHSFKTVLFHFINPKMFYGIDQLPSHRKPNIVVWLHGFEAEAWHRRYYNFLSDVGQLDAQLQRKEIVFEPQREFLRDIMTREELNIKFVYVSKRFKELYVDPFVGVVPERNYVIHNIIDDALFTYKKKTKDDRLNICSIRPYTAKNYANDITVDVIKKLSTKRYFNKLEFNLYGDGKLFNVITNPLKKFDNVHLHKGFVKQDDIPEIHQAHGIFLGPSRHDSQGVSLGEAMSSGLVPVTNAIGGIPEFIEHKKTGMLAERDNLDDMVDAIDYLYKHTKEFKKISQQAAASIRKQAGVETVINQEIEVITDGWS
ncbi:glycosyltransferase family 4 protein [Jeotgalicoccus huakuii]|uniref:glycosyltransferase family 4 protein n=1 Tax=Jeotgalicoccus sp. S0W5 TaxID=2527874 RepID=UPI00141502E3|nr:glycosyltransferase family 4 protein [Jeotgalicoccus sp. S0W5]MCK1976513.1 glycosyltransferase family 4 protein [Jeotgalicoccus huakuii]